VSRDAIHAPPRGTAAVAMIVVLIVVNVIVVGLTLGLARDHDLTLRRLETMKAQYAAEAGVNMAIREMLEDADEDVNGTIGTISAKTLGDAQFSVTASYDVPTAKTTLTSTGTCGAAKRIMLAEVYDS
jgi:type II secretory pathway component PulK